MHSKIHILKYCSEIAILKHESFRKTDLFISNSIISKWFPSHLSISLLVFIFAIVSIRPQFGFGSFGGFEKQQQGAFEFGGGYGQQQQQEVFGG